MPSSSRTIHHFVSEYKIMAKLIEHDKKVEEADFKFDKIIAKLVEHDEKLNNTVTKDEFREFKEEYLNRQDAVMAVLKRLDEDRVFINKNVGRFEDKVEEHSKDIKKLKLQLKIA